jgi:TolB-like protein/DNA-binding winged helix-turn-helix (wHTH) protein/Flp pilus assembly protein TadD
VIYQFGAYILDTETLELKSGADQITAEPQVFLLLQYLIENRARVVSRDNIIDAVWKGRVVSDSALTYAVSEARRLVGDDGKMQAVIRTLPRRGFRFVAEVTEESIGDEAVASKSSAPPPLAKPAPATRRRRIPAIAAALVVVIATSTLAWQQPWITKVEAADPEKLAFPLPDLPSIAVLPFENLSGDAKQDYLSDGFAENIITSLSRIPDDIFVIPWITTRAYRGKPVSVKQVSEELGVGYVLTGSVRRSGDQVRVTAHLIDALSGRFIWTELYDRNDKDTFAPQDSITLDVLTELKVKLTKGESARTLRGGTKSLAAYNQFQRGLPRFRRLNKNNYAEVQQLFREAVALDPNYAFAWNLLGWSHQLAVNRGFSDDPARDKAQAIELAHKAMALDPSYGGPYLLLSNNALREGRHDEAIAFAEKGVALMQNSPDSSTVLATALVFGGRPEDALTVIQSVKRFSPVTPIKLLRVQGLAYHTLGRYEEAAEMFELARARRPKGVFTLATLAMIYADMGRMEEARATTVEIFKVLPSFSAKRFVNAAMPHEDLIKSQHALTAMLQTGLPE